MSQEQSGAIPQGVSPGVITSVPKMPVLLNQAQIDQIMAEMGNRGMLPTSACPEQVQ